MGKNKHWMDGEGKILFNSHMIKLKNGKYISRSKVKKGGKLCFRINGTYTPVSNFKITNIDGMKLYVQ